MSKVFVGKAAEIRPESSKIFVVDGKQIVVINDRGTFRAFFNFCPHMGGALRFDGCQMYCAWHGATFDKESGEVMSGPASEGDELEGVMLSQDGEDLFVDFGEPKKSMWADDF